MKNIFKKLIFIALLSVIFMSGCTGDQMMAANSWPGLLVEGDLAYISNGNFIMAVNLTNGTMVWQFPEKPNNQMAFFANPVLANDQLIVGDYERTLYGINPRNGSLIWTFAEAGNRYIAEVLVSEDIIYAPSTDRSLYALDFNQNLLWKVKTGQALWAKPVSDGEVIYQASMDHKIYALDAKTGEKKWELDLGGAVGNAPATNDDGKLFIGSLANELVAIDKVNGEIEWRFPTDAGVWSRPLLHENVLYFGDLSGSFYAVDSQTGQMRWKLNTEGGVAGAAELIPGGIVYGTNAGEIVAVNLNGERLWTKFVDGKIFTPPGFINDRIYVAVTQGDYLLKAFTLDGVEIWSFNAPK